MTPGAPSLGVEQGKTRKKGQTDHQEAIQVDSTSDRQTALTINGRLQALGHGTQKSRYSFHSWSVEARAPRMTYEP